MILRNIFGNEEYPKLKMCMEEEDKYIVLFIATYYISAKPHLMISKSVYTKQFLDHRMASSWLEIYVEKMINNCIYSFILIFFLIQLKKYLQKSLAANKLLINSRE